MDIAGARMGNAASEAMSIEMTSRASEGGTVPKAPAFPLLLESGHVGLDLCSPTGVDPWAPWAKREPWFPSGLAADWDDVYRTWFGDGDRPVVNFNLMGSCPRAWDAKIRQCFGHLWREALNGGLEGWEATAKGCVAKLILVDQLPRHIFRGQKEAFSSDHIGVRLANRIAHDIARGAKLHIEDAFIIAWPWVHCESLDETYRAVWWHASLAEAARGTPYQFRALLNRYGAELHVSVIQGVGRYPHRNGVLGREATRQELDHLSRGADLWEFQQTKFYASLRYRVRAVGFFITAGLYTLSIGEGQALRTFLASCARALGRKVKRS